MHSDPLTSRSFGTGDDFVGRLVRVADPGPELPAGGTAAVKAAIRPEWHRQVARRRRSRQLAWTAGLAAAACLVLAVAAVLRPRPATTPVAVAVVGRIVGAVEVITADGQVRPVSAPGQSVVAGTELRTDDTSRVAVVLAGGQCLRLDRATSLRLASATEVELVAGAVYVDSGAAGAGGLAVSTALGVATDIGTQFEVRSSGSSLALRVREGSVRLDQAGDVLDVPSGFEATVTGEGATSTRVIAPHDPVWSWVQEVAPSFAIDGQTAASFLAWIGRETGLRISCTDAAEAIAAQSRLRGTTDGLTPLEAVAMVLPSCGLAARVEGSDLVVVATGE